MELSIVVRKSVVQALEEGAEVDGDCRLFRSKKKRPLVRYFGKQWHLNRLLWLLYTGEEVPADMLVCHKCDNPRCLVFEHLFLGTQQDNMTDKVQKGRAWRRVSPETAQAIKEARGQMTSIEAAGLFGVDASYVRRIWLGERRSKL